METNFPPLPRTLFPALADNDHVFLNSGGSGPPSSPTLEAMRQTEALCFGPAYLEGAAFYERQKDAADRARRAAAALIGAAPEDVALTQNTTHGMNLGTFSLDWQPGDEIISARPEHPGCLVPLHAVERHFGAKLRLLDPPVTVEKVERALGSRTRLVALSHVDWTTGQVLPLQEICAHAHERGALTLVDGAQSVGDIPVDAPELGVDMYAFTGHKWVLGPEGIGALYVRPGVQTQSTNVGYAALANPADFDAEGGYEMRSGARRFEASTMSPALCAGFAVAAEMILERGEDGFEDIRCRADRLIDLLSEIPRVTLRSPRPAESGLVSFEVAGLVAKDAVGRLLEQKFVLRFIPEPYPYIRASTHLFNTDDELEALVRAVAEL